MTAPLVPPAGMIGIAVCAAVGLASCSPAAPACKDEPPPTLVIAAADSASSGLRLLPPELLTELPFVVFGDGGATGDAGSRLPGLTRFYDMSDEGRTWTFGIWDNVPTHGGARVTTGYIKQYMQDRLAEAATFDPVSRDIVAIEAPTPTTLVIRLARPTRAIIESLHAINPGTSVAGPGLGTGPYRVVASTPDRVDYRAFPRFLEGPPRLAAVQTRYYASPRAAWAAFLRREADVLYDAPPSVAAQLAQNPDVALYPVFGEAQYVFGFQQRSPRLKDPRIRRALNMAVDRADLVRRAFSGYSQPASGPFSPSYAAANGAEPTWRYDPIAARAELAAARGGDTRPLEIACLTSNETPRAADVTAALEAQLAPLNVRLKIEAVPVAELARRMAAGEFETYVTSFPVLRRQLWPYILWHSSAPSPIARAHYTAADAALDEAYGAMDEAAERHAVRRVHEVMREDPPAAFLALSPVISAVRRRWRLPNTRSDAPEIRESFRLWTLASSACGAP